MKPRRGLLLAPRASVYDDMMGIGGTVMYLALQSDRYRQLSVAALGTRITPPIMANQMAIFYRWNDSLPVGYVTWAFLAPDVELRLMADPNAALHPSEWNEGESLWIMDFLALPGWCEDIVEYIDQNMFEGHAQAFSVRKNHRGYVRKTCWKRRSGTCFPELAPGP